MISDLFSSSSFLLHLSDFIDASSWSGLRNADCYFNHHVFFKCKQYYACLSVRRSVPWDCLIRNAFVFYDWAPLLTYLTPRKEFAIIGGAPSVCFHEQTEFGDVDIFMFTPMLENDSVLELVKFLHEKYHIISECVKGGVIVTFRLLHFPHPIQLIRTSAKNLPQQLIEFDHSAVRCAWYMGDTWVTPDAEQSKKHKQIYFTEPNSHRIKKAHLRFPSYVIINRFPEKVYLPKSDRHRHLPLDEEEIVFESEDWVARAHSFLHSGNSIGGYMKKTDLYAEVNVLDMHLGDSHTYTWRFVKEKNEITSVFDRRNHPSELLNPHILSSERVRFVTPFLKGTLSRAGVFVIDANVLRQIRSNLFCFVQELFDSLKERESVFAFPKKKGDVREPILLGTTKRNLKRTYEWSTMKIKKDIQYILNDLLHGEDGILLNGNLDDKDLYDRPDLMMKFYVDICTSNKRNISHKVENYRRLTLKWVGAFCPYDP